MVSIADLEGGTYVKYVGNAWEIGSDPDAETHYGKVLEQPKIRRIFENIDENDDAPDIFVLLEDLENRFRDYIHIGNILRVLSNEEATLVLLEY